MNYIPEKARVIVNEHINMIEAKIRDFLEAYYIYGSISLGAFDNKASDIDFIAVVGRRETEADINILKKIHHDMCKKFNKINLDGIYVMKDDIVSINRSENPCLRFNDGKFIGFRQFDRNSIDAYQLKKYGITVKGQIAEDLDITVDFNILIDKMQDNLNTYWLNWINRCSRFPTAKYIGLFISLRAIEWGVLGVSRLYYTFREKDITSKVGAGEYVLRSVPEKWHRIIEESMRLRKSNKKSYYNSVIKRRNDTINYIIYIIDECNRLLPKRIHV